MRLAPLNINALSSCLARLKQKKANKVLLFYKKLVLSALNLFQRFNLSYLCLWIKKYIMLHYRHWIYFFQTKEKNFFVMCEATLIHSFVQVLEKWLYSLSIFEFTGLDYPSYSNTILFTIPDDEKYPHKSFKQHETK